MSLITLLVVVIILGLVLYLIQLLPLAPPFRTIVYCLVVLIFIVWLLSFVGVVNLGGGPRLR